MVDPARESRSQTEEKETADYAEYAEKKEKVGLDLLPQKGPKKHKNGS